MILGAALYVLLGLFVLGCFIASARADQLTTPSNNNPTRNTPDEIREQAGRGFHGERL